KTTSMPRRCSPRQRKNSSRASTPWNRSCSAKGKSWVRWIWRRWMRFGTRSRRDNSSLTMETEYKVRLEIFEGPLDLLLYLIKRDEIDIYDISLERITRQYLEYLEAFKELNIEVAGEFVVMAANLIYLKSRSLLPVDQQPPEEDADEDDPRWDLI